MIRLFSFVLVGCLMFSQALVAKNSVANEIERKFIQKLMEDYPILDKKDIFVDFKSHIDFFKKPYGTSYYTFEFKKDSKVLGQTILPLNFYDESGKLLKSYRIATETSAMISVISTKKFIRKNEILSRDNIEIIRKPLKGMPKRAIHSLDFALGKESISSLGKRVVLTDWMVRDRPDIAKGDPLLILYKRGKVELKIKGLAMEDGRIGDRIRVKSQLASKKVIKGVLIDDQTIRWSHTY